MYLILYDGHSPVAGLWERAQNQSAVAWYKADPLSMVHRVHMETAFAVALKSLIPLITTFTLSPPPMALNLDPFHLVKMSSKLDLAFKAPFDHFF